MSTNTKKSVSLTRIKATALLLAIITLLTVGAGLTGCQKKMDIPAEITTRSPEEIAATGVTAEDVLAELDLLSRDIVVAKYTHRNQGAQTENEKYDLSTIKAKFSSIRGVPCYEFEPPVEYPYFIEDDYWFNTSEWLTQDDLVGYTFCMYPCYGVSWSMAQEVEGIQNDVSLDLNVPKYLFENLMKNMNKEQSILTNEKIQQHPECFSDDAHLNKTIYDNFTIDSSYIKSLTADQLTAMYEFLKNIRPLIFEPMTQDKANTLSTAQVETSD